MLKTLSKIIEHDRKIIENDNQNDHQNDHHRNDHQILILMLIKIQIEIEIDHPIDHLKMDPLGPMEARPTCFSWPISDLENS